MVSAAIMWCRSMGELEEHFAAKLRRISAKVLEWESRDFQEESDPKVRGTLFMDLEELAASFDGTSDRFVATMTAKQNWPESVRRLDRDMEIARFVHRYRTEPGLKVKDGIEQAARHFGIGEETVKRANRELGGFFRSGNEDIAFLMLGLERSKLATLTKTKG